MPEAQTFYHVIRPLIVTNFIFGLGWAASFKHPWSRFLEIAYSTFCLVGLCLLFYYAKGDFTSPEFKSALYINKTVITASFFVNTGLTVLLIVVTKFRSKVLRTAMEMIEACDKKMHRMGLPTCYRSLYHFQAYTIGACTLFIGTTVLYMYYFGLTAPMPNTKKLVFVLLWNNLWSVIQISDISFYIFIRYTSARLQQLNDLLRDMQKTSPQRRGVPATVFDFETKKYSHFKDEGYRSSNGNVSTMRVVKQTHLELIKIARVVNDAYGLQILLTTTVSFIIVICLCYSCYKILLLEVSLMEFTRAILPVVCWILFFIVKFCALSYTCATATATAADTGDIICELYKPSATKEYRVEIRDFILQLIQNPLVFKACGFFNIDHSFLQTIVRTITTYLVILIQVGDTPKPTQSPAINNVTVSTPETTSLFAA